MKHITAIDTRDEFFHVLATAKESQIALMTLQPGQTSGEYDNEHPKSEQLLYVIDGTGEAKIEGKAFAIKTGDAILIEKAEKHQIKNTGEKLLKTVDFYAPPAY